MAPAQRHVRAAAVLVAIAIAITSPAAAQSAAPAPAATTLSEARALINQDRPAEAIEKLTAIDGPGRLEVALLLGVAYYHANDQVHAIERLEPIVDKLEDGSIERREAVQVLGLCYFLAGRFADAVPRLEATREWAAGNAELGYVLGKAYIQTRQADRARAEFARTFASRQRNRRRRISSPRR